MRSRLFYHKAGFENMPRKIWLFIYMLGAVIVFPMTASALPPPEVIDQINRNADVIVLGRVLTVTPLSSTHSCFELEVTRVVKGLEQVKPGRRIKVRFKSEPVEVDGLNRHCTGVLPVRVEAGQSIKAYLNPPRAGESFFAPVLRGSSVITMPDEE